MPPEKGKTPWRVNYKLGPAVDASGELPEGRAFGGFAELNALLAGDEAVLARAFVAHLSRYATGTEVGYADRAEIERIVANTEAGGHGLRAMIHELAASRLFRPVTE